MKLNNQDITECLLNYSIYRSAEEAKKGKKELNEFINHGINLEI